VGFCYFHQPFCHKKFQGYMVREVGNPWVDGAVSWAPATKAGRVDSFPGWVIPKTWKSVLVACPASCSAWLCWCEGTVHAPCCHWPGTSAAFTTKTVARAPRRPLAQKIVQKPVINETEQINIWCEDFSVRFLPKLQFALSAFKQKPFYPIIVYFPSSSRWVFHQSELKLFCQERL